MEKTKKIGGVALLESQRFDNKSIKITIIGLFLLAENSSEISELTTC